MFKGTDANPNGVFSEKVARNGGNENAFTSLDYTGYHQTVASDRLEMVMALEADRMRGLVLKEDDINTERKVILEERLQRIGNNPNGKLSLQLSEALFPGGHAYGRPIIGWEDDINAITRDDLAAFYHRHYTPDNAILVVAGDVKTETVKRLAKRYYGPIKAAPPVKNNTKRVSLPMPTSVARAQVELRDPAVRQPAWRLNVLAPSLGTGDKRRVAALEVLAEILGGGATSRLYRAMVVEDANAVGVGVHYNSNSRGPTSFVFYASPRPGFSLGQMADAIKVEVEALLAGGLKDGELVRTKKRMLSEAIFARDDMKTGAWVLGGALASGHTIADVEEWPARIRSLSEADIMAALRAIWAESRRVEAHLLPGGAVQ